MIKLLDLLANLGIEAIIFLALLWALVLIVYFVDDFNERLTLVENRKRRLSKKLKAITLSKSK